MAEKRFKIDEEWQEIPEGIRTFGALREWVGEHLEARGRVLLGVLHGESSATQEELAAWAERPLGELGALEFLSAEPTALARRTCAEMIALLDRLVDRAESAAEELRSGERGKALEGVLECAEGWVMVLGSYRDLVRFAGMDLSTAEVGGRSFTAMSADLAGIIERIRGEIAQERGETLADLLTQELSLYVEPMREAFERVQAELT